MRYLDERDLHDKEKSTNGRLTLETATGIILGKKMENFTITVTLIFIYGTCLGYFIFIV